MVRLVIWDAIEPINYDVIVMDYAASKELFTLVPLYCVLLWFGADRYYSSLQWRHNECDGVSNHQPYDCLRNRLFRHRWKKASKLRVTGLCVGNSPVTDEFPAQMASNTEKVSIWWRHHGSLQDCEQYPSDNKATQIGQPLVKIERMLMRE